MYYLKIDRMVDRHLKAILYHFKSCILERIDVDELEQRIWEMILEWEEAGFLDLNPISDKEFLMWCVIYRIMHLNDEGNWREQLNETKMIDFVNDFSASIHPDISVLEIKENKKTIKAAVQKTMAAKRKASYGSSRLSSPS